MSSGLYKYVLTLLDGERLVFEADYRIREYKILS